ncbi:MAG: DUF4423 domain-containing protein [Myxococcota bacterium]
MAGRRRNSDYREYLRHLLRERELLQRDLALKMKRSPAWASQILNGRRKLQRHLAEEVTQVLLLDDAERWEFLRLVDLETSPAPSSPRRPSAGDDECGPSLSQWYVGAIAELARCDQYRPDPEWVAAALRPRIDVAQAREAMELLVRLGLLDTGFRVAGSTEAKRRGCRSGDREGQAVLQLALDVLQTAPPNERRHLVSSVALSEDAYDRFQLRMQELFVDLLASEQEVEANRVYQISLAAFPVSLYTDSAAHPATIED